MILEHSIGSGVRWDRGVRWAWQKYPLENSAMAIAGGAPAGVSCTFCGQQFASRNKVFSHLRADAKCAKAAADLGIRLPPTSKSIRKVALLVGYVSSTPAADASVRGPARNTGADGSTESEQSSSGGRAHNYNTDDSVDRALWCSFKCFSSGANETSEAAATVQSLEPSAGGDHGFTMANERMVGWSRASSVDSRGSVFLSQAGSIHAVSELCVVNWPNTSAGKLGTAPENEADEVEEKEVRPIDPAPPHHH